MKVLRKEGGGEPWASENHWLLAPQGRPRAHEGGTLVELARAGTEKGDMGRAGGARRAPEPGKAF